MQYITNTTKLHAKNTAIALGKFEGLHLGHQALFDEIKANSAAGLCATVFTFDKPPGRVLCQTEDGFLYTADERVKLLEAMDIDLLVSYPFTEEFAKMEPEAFVSDILKDMLDMQVLVVGDDFCFGRNRSGNVALLRMLQEKYHYTLRVIPQKKIQTADGTMRPISSTMLREELTKGNMEFIAKCLGRAFSYEGNVTPGRQIGRTIGFPTANLVVPTEKTNPPYGVYAVEVLCYNKVYQGVANLGVKPTVSDGESVSLETYIFDFEKELYHQPVKVQLLSFLRPEQKFDGMEALKQQINEDQIHAKTYFENR